MPEEIEVDTDKLHEAIHEEVEKEGSPLLRTIALTTALLAALAAVAALLAGSSVNEALALKTEAAQLQTQASDQWAYYQAKGIKAVVLESQKSLLASLDKPIPPDIEKNLARHNDEQQQAQKKAQELESQRDEKGVEADKLIHRHHFFANAVALLQVAIALGAVAALTRKRLAWLGSMALGIIGAAIFVWGLVAS
ncbi:DUF4337 domain-containing protein [Pseudaminobacter soli (ex Li et al. 2025)]|uniref:DUF4337 domain-containing protein n=1 Tax=Pseudaminobacter soli (ex Li et al. 2025) TaxID=1295366 RepID=A0A2P7SNV5_9HYPH|nr:DUF4337 domain-containing protein [Mesorhizobium soli]PSJ64176.1 hypothetical protein C7I85_03490 [Mesorhizobium soli]